MVQINFATREVSCKVVYYGPGLCGKTTNLQQVHNKAPSQRRGHLTSIATEGDRTLFFDFMPLALGTVAGMKTKLQLYTVPGQVYYNATRKIVLEGVDGIIFVADSSASRREANRESWQNLKDNLREYGLDVTEVPVVIQFNKRDLPDAMPVEEMKAELNELGVPTFPAVAVTGEGVMATLRKLASLVLQRLNEQRPRRAARRSVAAPVEEAEPAVKAAAQKMVAAAKTRAVAPKAPAAAPTAPARKLGPEPVAPVTAAAARQTPEPARAVSKRPQEAGVASARPPAPPPPGKPSAGRLRVVMAGGERRKQPSTRLMLVIVGIAVIVVTVVVALLVQGGR